MQRKENLIRACLNLSLLSGMIAFSWMQSKSSAVYDHFTKGHDLYVQWAKSGSQQQLKDALTEMELAHKVSPKNLTVLDWVGFLRMKNGLYHEAVSALQQANAIDPTDPKPLINLGFCNAKLGHFDTSALNYRSAITDLQLEGEPGSRHTEVTPLIDADLYTAYYSLGGVYRDQRSYSLAISAYQSALTESDKLASNQPSIKTGISVSKSVRDAEIEDAIGSTQLADGENANAEASVKLALAAQPDNASYWNDLGVISRNEAVSKSTQDPNSYWKQAVDAFSHSIQLDPQNYSARDQYATALVKTANYSEAVKQFKMADSLRAGVTSATPMSADTVLQYGLAAMHTGDTTKAASLFNQVTLSDPSMAQGWEWQGYLQMQHDDYSSAEASFQHSLKLDPSSSTVKYNLAQCAYLSGDYTQASNGFQQLINAGDTSSQVYNGLGNALLKGNHYLSAIQAYQHLASDNSVEANARIAAYNAIGYSQLKLGAVSEAADSYQSALSLSPSNHDALIGLASTRLTMAKSATTSASTSAWSQASDAIHNAVEVIPNNPDLQVALGEVYIHQDKTDPAIKVLKEAVSQDPNNIDALMMLAKAESQNDPASAEPDLEKVIHNQPDNTSAKNLLIGTEMLMLQYNKALPVLQQMHQQNPADTTISLEESACLYGLKQYKQDADLLHQAVSMPGDSPNQAHLIRSLAYLYLTGKGVKQNDQAAETLYQKSLTMVPHNADALRGLGIISTRAGANYHALTYLTEAIHADPSDDSLYVARGVCYENLQNIKLAIADYRKAIQINPDNTEAQAALQRFAMVSH